MERHAERESETEKSLTYYAPVGRRGEEERGKKKKERETVNVCGPSGNKRKTAASAMTF